MKRYNPDEGWDERYCIGCKEWWPVGPEAWVRGNQICRACISEGWTEPVKKIASKCRCHNKTYCFTPMMLLRAA